MMVYWNDFLLSLSIFSGNGFSLVVNNNNNIIIIVNIIINV